MPATEKMYRYAFSILKDAETAADVVQECLLKIWEKRDMLPEIQNPDSWAMRITRNQCYDWVKMNRFTLIGAKELNQSDNQSADGQVLVNDYQKWLVAILDSLPERHREIFHLREVEELSYQDIAVIVGISLSDVKVTLHRVRGKIRTGMQKIEEYGIAN